MEGKKGGRGEILKQNGRHVLPRFSKVESLELIFLLETGVLRINFCQNLRQELKFSQTQKKLGLDMQNFAKNRNRGSGAEKALEIVGLWSKKK